MRTVYLIAFWLFFNHTTYGQQILFQGMPVDTVEIITSAGYYHFDTAGTTTGRRDAYIVAFNKHHNKYISICTRTNIKLTLKPKTETYKVYKIKRASFNKLPMLDDLLNSFSKRFKRPAIDQLGITDENVSKIVTRKKILRIAKAYKEDWHFNHEYATKHENDSIFRGCQNTDTLQLFLDSLKIDTSSYVVTADYWDEVKINVSCKNRLFSFEGKYPNKWKQPFYEKSETAIGYKSIFNLDINRYLFRILPTYFYRKDAISTEAIINSYIIWYLKRRDIIGDYD
ncbi:MAG: hypothetical protein ACTHJ0_16885, partial [Flavipsychrobacter sp.]